ncbi:MAG: hypothetical protein JXB49_10195 [Bacteroidales bacterium]|nr:hypothetical protein [Bacteroidales bacterium]
MILIWFLLFSVIAADFLRIVSNVGKLNINISTYLSLFLYYLSIVVLLYFAKKTNWKELHIDVKVLYFIWLVVLVSGLLHSAFTSNNYWDWKFLFMSAVTFSTVPLVFCLGVNYFSPVFSFFLKFMFPFAFAFIPLNYFAHELYSRLVVPASIYLLFIPYLNKKTAVKIGIVVFISVFICIDFRANLLKVFISLCLLLLFKLRKYINLNMLRFAHVAVFIVPICLLLLGISGRYNILQEISYYDKVIVYDNEGNEYNMLGDSRTDLFVEVFDSLNQTGNWLFGEGAAGYYETFLFVDSGGGLDGKRYGSEVGALNIIFKYGLIGIFCYFCLLLYISYIAIYYSNNYLSKMLGLLIASRWMLSFVEEFTQYDLNFFFFWLVIGLVSSTWFRKMTDEEVVDYLNII